MTTVSDASEADVPRRVLFRGVFLAGFATLLLQIALIRILSFTIWYHFAYVVISTALLGFGAAGTLVAVFPGIGARDLRRTLARCSLLAAATAVGTLVFISIMPLHPMQVARQPSQLILLVVYQLMVTIPFLFSGLVISLSLRAMPERVDRLYFWDLIGAGLGALVAVMVMNLMAPPGAVLVASTGFAAAGAVFSPRNGARYFAFGLGAALLLGSAVAVRIPFTPAQSKHLAMQTQKFKLVPVYSKWTALFRTDVVEDRELGPPVDWIIGQSLSAPGDLLFPRYFVHHDASAGTAIYDLTAGSRLDFLDYHVLRVPYLVATPSPRVLVIGVGGGIDVIAALQYGASRVTGVELDPVTVELIRTELNDVADGLFRRPTVRLVAGEGRHFVSRSNESFDLIQLTGVDTLAAMFSGAYVLAENYLYTVEAFHDYFDSLAPGGVLSFATGILSVTSPAPRAAGRMVSVAQQALRERGVERPQDHIAVIASRTLLVEILIQPEPFTPDQVQRLSEFAEQVDFEVLHLPGLEGHPVYDKLASSEGEERENLLAGLTFHVDAITDDRPFFFKFYRWGKLFGVEPLAPAHTTALGQIVLLILLVTLTLLGAVLILGPLVVFNQRGIGEGGRRRAGVLFYFLAIGVGFMLFEISLMQRFVLFLGYPTYSLTVTLSSLLIFLGWGSFLSRKWLGREQVVLPLGVVAIAILALFYQSGLPLIQARTLGASLPVRTALTVAMLAPLGLVLGGFLPLGIRRAAEVHRDLVPWAWGINGCASVTATVLAVVLAMGYGFTRVWALSVGIYAVGVAALLLSGRTSRAS